jgi:hypothetical protein
MTEKVAAEGSAERDDYKRHDDNRHDRVRSQNCQIDWSRNSLPGKTCRAVVRVIDNVRDEKDQWVESE